MALEIALAKATKKGRPRKSDVRRFPCGAIKEPEHAATPEILKQRASIVGEGRALDAKAGSILGQMHLLGYLTDGQHEAGQKFQRVAGRYLGVIGTKSMDMSVGSGGPLGEELNPAEYKRIREGYFKAIGELNSAESRAIRLGLLDNTPITMWEIGQVREGLEKLRSYFGIPVDKKRKTA